MELDHYVLGMIFTIVAIVTLLVIIVFSRWPARKDRDD